VISGIGDAINLTFVNNSQKTVKIDWVAYDGALTTYGEPAPGVSFEQPTYLTHPWAVSDSETGILSAVFQQLTDYNGQSQNTVKICDDGNGNLIIEYDPVPEAHEVEKAPEEEEKLEVNDYDQEVEEDEENDVFQEWNEKWKVMQ
jgi:hypothetical protein